MLGYRISGTEQYKYFWHHGVKLLFINFSDRNKLFKVTKPYSIFGITHTRRRCSVERKTFKFGSHEVSLGRVPWTHSFFQKHEDTYG